MAKTFDGTNITEGFNIKAAHVSQSVDAFTGAEAYDVKLSGSLETTGSIDVKGNISSSFLRISDDSNLRGNLRVGDSSLSNGISSSGYLHLGNDLVANADHGILKAQSITSSSPNPAAGNISASGYVIAQNLTASQEISCSQNILSSRVYVGNFPSGLPAPASGTTSLIYTQGNVVSTNDILATSGKVLANNITSSGGSKLDGLTQLGGNIQSSGNYTSTGNITLNNADPLTNLTLAAGYISAGSHITASGNISASGTMFSNAISVGDPIGNDNLRYSAINKLFQLYSDSAKFTLGIGPASATRGKLEMEYNSSYSNNDSGLGSAVIQTTTVPLTITSIAQDVYIRSTANNKQIILQVDTSSGGSSKGVLISGSSDSVGLDVRGMISSSADIHAMGFISASKFELKGTGGEVQIRHDSVPFSAAKVERILLKGSAKMVMGDGSTNGDAFISYDTYIGNSNNTSSINYYSNFQITSEQANSDLELQSRGQIKLKPFGGNDLPVLISGSNGSGGHLDVRGDITGSRIQVKDNSLSLFDPILHLKNNSNHGNLMFVNYQGQPKLTLHNLGATSTFTSTGSVDLLVGKGTYIPTNTPVNEELNQGLFRINLDDRCSLGQIVMDRGNNTNNAYGRFDITSKKKMNTFPEFSFYMNSNKLPDQSGTPLPGGGGLAINAHLSVGGEAYKINNTLWNTISDARLKENIITASIDTCYDNLKSLPLKHYKWKEGISENPISDNNVLGWIAQDVEKVFPKAISKTKFTTWSTYTGSVAISSSSEDFMLQPGERYRDVLAGSEIIEDRHSLQADQIVKMMYGAIQKLQEKVEALELQISGSNS